MMFHIGILLSVTVALALAQDPCVINNVCYVIDQSGSINSNEYVMEQEFVIAIAEAIDKRSSEIPSNSAVAFADTAEIIGGPTTSLSHFIDIVQRPRLFPNGKTFISRGLQTCIDNLQNETENRIIVLVTDGRAKKPSRSETVATDAKAQGFDIVTVGIGSNVDKPFLRRIASAPEFFINAEFDDIMTSLPPVVDAICDVPESGDSCEEAYAKCEFKFKGESGLTKYDVSQQQDKSFTPQIMSKDPMIGLAVLNTNGIIPEFIDANGARNITQFAKPNFTPTHFKPYWIQKERADGIGHQTFHGTQASEAVDRCVRVFFTHFQEFRGTTISNRNNVEREENKCVVFRT